MKQIKVVVTPKTVQVTMTHGQWRSFQAAVDSCAEAEAQTESGVYQDVIDLSNDLAQAKIIHKTVKNGKYTSSI